MYTSMGTVYNNVEEYRDVNLSMTFSFLTHSSNYQSPGDGQPRTVAQERELDFGRRTAGIPWRKV